MKREREKKNTFQIEDRKDQELIQSDHKLDPKYTKGKKSQHEVGSVDTSDMMNRVSSPFTNRR